MRHTTGLSQASSPSIASFVSLIACNRRVAAGLPAPPRSRPDASPPPSPYRPLACAAVSKAVVAKAPVSKKVALSAAVTTLATQALPALAVVSLGDQQLEPPGRGVGFQPRAKPVTKGGTGEERKIFPVPSEPRRRRAIRRRWPLTRRMIGIVMPRAIDVEVYARESGYAARTCARRVGDVKTKMTTGSRDPPPWQSN